MKVELTKWQCMNIANFIERNLLDAIRNDEGIDSVDYVKDILDVKTAIEKAVDEYENG